MKYKNKEAKLLKKGQPDMYKIRDQEVERAKQEDRDAKEQHGPVKVLMQGGKKCNIKL